MYWYTPEVMKLWVDTANYSIIIINDELPYLRSSE